MPENVKRVGARPKEEAALASSSSLDGTVDLLTEEEENIILAVIKRDELERSIINAKIIEVRKEIQEIRQAGALTPGDDLNDICARCKFKFPPFLLPWADHGQRCVSCKFRVCAKCSRKEMNGSWLCILCSKYRQEKHLTGDWILRGGQVQLQQHTSSQPVDLFGSDLLRASLKEKKLRKERSALHKSTLPEHSNRHSSMLPEHSYKHSSKRGHYSTPQASDGSPGALDRATKDERSSIRGSHSRRLKAPNSVPLTKVRSNSVVVSLFVDNSGESSDSRTQKGTDFCDDCSDSHIHNDSSHVLGSSHLSEKLLNPSVHPNQRRILNRILSVSEQSLYYDDGKLSSPPQFQSLDSRSVTSLCSDYSNNPKYRSLKPSSGTSELELFRKRGEMFSMRRRRTLESEPSEDKSDSKLTLDQDSFTSSCQDKQSPSQNSCDSYNENQAGSADSAFDTPDKKQTSGSIEDSTEGSDHKSNNNEEEKKLIIPHWHEILRMQSTVDSWTKQSKTPPVVAPADPPVKLEEDQDCIFRLMRPRLTREAVVKNMNHLSPGNSKDDSSSSQESISVYVASYMSPTQDLNPDQIFPPVSESTVVKSDPPAGSGSESSKSATGQLISSELTNGTSSRPTGATWSPTVKQRQTVSLLRGLFDEPSSIAACSCLHGHLWPQILSCILSPIA